MFSEIVLFNKLQDTADQKQQYHYPLHGIFQLLLHSIKLVDCILRYAGKVTGKVRDLTIKLLASKCKGKTTSGKSRHS